MHNNKITFFELIAQIEKKCTNKNINNSLIYFFSQKVKNLTDLLVHRNEQIDFDYNELMIALDDYYNKHKPLTTITKQRHFNGINLKVFYKVHYPRNETELLAEKIEEVLAKDSTLNSLIDICAGTGNLGISIKSHFSKLRLSLLDIDTNAINNIRFNLDNNKLEARIINQDFFEFIKTNTEKYDVIVFNPPYVKKEELDLEIIKFENKISFSNSDDSLEFYKVLLSSLDKVTNSKHYLIGIEFGYDQKQDLEKILKSVNLLQFSRFYKDLNNQDRFLIIYR